MTSLGEREMGKESVCIYYCIQQEENRQVLFYSSKIQIKMLADILVLA